MWFVHPGPRCPLHKGCEGEGDTESYGAYPSPSEGADGAGQKPQAREGTAQAKTRYLVLAAFVSVVHPAARFLTRGCHEFRDSVPTVTSRPRTTATDHPPTPPPGYVTRPSADCETRS